jgi:hypothetical protein
MCNTALLGVDKSPQLTIASGGEQYPTQGERTMNLETIYKMEEDLLRDVHAFLFQTWRTLSRHDEPIDVRVQVVSRYDVRFHDGDPCYDLDHRGHWGAGVIDSHFSEDDITDLASDLVDQVIESVALSEGGE